MQEKITCNLVCLLFSNYICQEYETDSYETLFDSREDVVEYSMTGSQSVKCFILSMKRYRQSCSYYLFGVQSDCLTLSESGKSLSCRNMIF